MQRAVKNKPTNLQKKKKKSSALATAAPDLGGLQRHLLSELQVRVAHKLRTKVLRIAGCDGTGIERWA